MPRERRRHRDRPQVAQSLSPECDAEALRVVAMLTGWQPAIRRGSRCRACAAARALRRRADALNMNAVRKQRRDAANAARQ